MKAWPETVLVADDASPDAETAVRTAVTLTAATGARLFLVHVKSTSHYIVGDSPSPSQQEALRREGEIFLDQRIAQVKAQGGQVDRHWVRLSPKVEREIARVAEEHGVDLLVVPKRGQSYPQRRALGDLSLQLVRDAPCSVLVVRSPHTPPPRRRLASSPGTHSEG